jgi:Protein of unknown function (DUF2975)
MDPMPSRAARIAQLALTVAFWIAVVIGLVLVSHRLFGFGQDAGTMSIPVSFSIDQTGRVPQDVEIAGTLSTTVDVHDPSLQQRVIAAVPVFVWWTLVVVVLWLLRRVVRAAAKGNPFQSTNVTTLRWLGAIFLVGFPLATFIERSFTEWFFSAGVWTGGRLPPGGLAPTAPLLSGPAILAAVTVFALAEVFAYGARLREDVDATI